MAGLSSHILKNNQTSVNTGFNRKGSADLRETHGSVRVSVQKSSASFAFAIRDSCIPVGNSIHNARDGESSACFAFPIRDSCIPVGNS